MKKIKWLPGRRQSWVNLEILKMAGNLFNENNSLTIMATWSFHFFLHLYVIMKITSSLVYFSRFFSYISLPKELGKCFFRVPGLGVFVFYWQGSWSSTVDLYSHQGPSFLYKPIEFSIQNSTCFWLNKAPVSPWLLKRSSLWWDIPRSSHCVWRGHNPPV